MQLNYAAASRTHMHSSGEFVSTSKKQRNKVIYQTTVTNVAVRKDNSGMYAFTVYTYNTNQRKTATKLQQTRKSNLLLEE